MGILSLTHGFLKVSVTVIYHLLPAGGDCTLNLRLWAGRQWRETPKGLTRGEWEGRKRKEETTYFQFLISVVPEHGHCCFMRHFLWALPAPAVLQPLRETRTKPFHHLQWIDHCSLQGKVYARGAECGKTCKPNISLLINMVTWLYQFYLLNWRGKCN